MTHRIAAGLDPNTGRPIVTLPFTNHGSHEFQRITRAEYDRGRVNAGLAGQVGAHGATSTSRYAGHNAIVLDGQLTEAPFIDYTDAALADGIVGDAQITEPSTAVARRTALVLETGSLPFRFEQVGLGDCGR